jgi:hypothetical protein
LSELQLNLHSQQGKQLFATQGHTHTKKKKERRKETLNKPEKLITHTYSGSPICPIKLAPDTWKINRIVYTYPANNDLKLQDKGREKLSTNHPSLKSQPWIKQSMGLS